MKESRRTTILIGLAAAVLVAIGIGRRCTGGTSSLVMEYQRPRGDTLAVAIEMSPTTYTFENDSAEGFDYELLRVLAAEHGMELSICPVSNLESAFQGLYDGRFDLIVANIAATSRVADYFPLTDAVYLDRQVLVQRRLADGSVPVNGQLDLRGDTVYLPAGSPARLRMENMSGEMGDTVYLKSIPGHNGEHLAILTERGVIPRAVVSRRVAESVAEDYPELDISTPVSFNQKQVWAVAPGDSALLDSLNIWLAKFKTTEAYSRLEHRYL